MLRGATRGASNIFRVFVGSVRYGIKGRVIFGGRGAEHVLGGLVVCYRGCSVGVSCVSMAGATTLGVNTSGEFSMRLNARGSLRDGLGRLGGVVLDLGGNRGKLVELCV